MVMTILSTNERQKKREREKKECLGFGHTHTNTNISARARTNKHNRTSVLVLNATYHMIFKRLCNLRVYAWRLSPSRIIWPLSSCRVFFPFCECNQLSAQQENNCPQPLEGLGCSATWHMNNSLLTSQTVRLLHIVRTECIFERKQSGQLQQEFVLQQYWMILKWGEGRRRRTKHLQTHDPQTDLWLVV